LQQDSLSPKVAANYHVNQYAGTSLQKGFFDIPSLVLASQSQNYAIHVCLFSSSLSKSAEAYGCVEVRLGAFDIYMRKDTIGEIKSSIDVMKRVLNSHNTTTLMSSRSSIGGGLFHD